MNDMPVQVYTRHDTSADYAYHARLLVGYEETDKVVYLHDPAGWWRWACGYDASVSYSTFDSLWNVRAAEWLNPWAHYRGGVVGYPGDFSTIQPQVSVSGLPSNVDAGQYLTLIFTVNNVNYHSGIHVRLEGATFTSAAVGSFDWYSAYDANGNPISIGGSRILEFYEDNLNGGTMSRTVSATIRVSGDSNPVKVYYRAWLLDKNDLLHCLGSYYYHTTTIDDDRNLAGGPNTIQMPRV